VFAAPETSPVVSITAIWTSSYERPLAAANAEVPGRGAIAPRVKPVLPIVVVVYQSATEETARSVAPSSSSSAVVISLVGSSRMIVSTAPSIATSSAVAVPPPDRLNVIWSPAAWPPVGADARVTTWSAPLSTMTTLSELPWVPADLAARTLADPTPDSHAVSLAISTPPPLAAFSTPSVSARTTASLPP